MTDSGIFCAVPSADSSCCTAARFHAFTTPELPREDASSLRLELCPERPDQTEEMRLAEASAWGRSLCAGASQVMYLLQGARFELSCCGQKHTLTWSAPPQPS